MTAFALTSAAPSPSQWRGLRALLASLLGAESPVAVHAGFRASHDALRRRDPDAWREVFEHEHAAIYRYAAGRLGGGQEAEDLTSQVFAGAWENAASFGDQGVPIRAWLFGIARNMVNSHRRRLLRRPPIFTFEARDHAGNDPALDVQRIDLMKAIAELETSWAEVVTLRFVHGLSAQETAIALGTSVAAVKGKQARALAQLRENLTIRD